MSKPSAVRMLFPAVWIVAVVAIAGAALVAAGVAKSSHRASTPVATASPKHEIPDSNSAAAQGRAQSGRVQARYAALPLAFEANEGQTDPQVKYMARGNGYTLFLTSGDAVLSLVSKTSARDSYPKQVMQNRVPGYSLKTKKLLRRKQPRFERQPSSVASIGVHLIDGNPAAGIAGEGMLSSKVNYFIGNDPNQWHAGVTQYSRVTYKNVYPGVNLAYYGHQSQLEFDFIVAPGASPTPISLSFPGAARAATDVGGNLVLSSSAGDVVLNKPVAYQERNGIRETVPAEFVLQAGNKVRFELGGYDRSRELVIDPSLSYASYLGGNSEDVGFGVAVDSSLNAYITGHSDSTSGFPGGNPSNGGFDAFVVQIKPDGTRGYTTFVGGSADDLGAAIAVDASGVYVAGITTSTDFPATGGAQSTAGSGANATCPGGGSSSGPCTDAIAFKLDTTGARVWGTYIGGNDFDDGFGIAVDTLGHAYVTGDTFSPNFPTKNALDASLNNGAGIDGSDDAFVTEISADGSVFVYSTYLGGTLTDLGFGITVDSAGDAYVVGETFSSDYPSTNGSVCGTDGACNFDGSFYYFDAFVTKVAPLGASVLNSTFLGGSSDDSGLGIAVDSSGNVYVAGETTFDNPFAAVPDFPITGSAFQQNYGGGSGHSGAGANGFVSKLNPTFTTLTYSSYLGGSNADVAFGIGLDSSNPPNAYVTGTALSADFPTASAFQTALSGTSDAFVSEVNSTGSTLSYSSYLGGTGNENYDSSTGNFFGGAIAVDASSGNAYLTGSTTSASGFPVTPGTVVQGSYGGNPFDAFAVTVLSPLAPDFTVGATTPAAVAQGGSGTSTVTLTSLNAYNQSVTLACTVTGNGSPLPSCSASSAFSANPVTPTSGGATSTLTITTTGKIAALYRPSNIFYAMWLPIVGLTLVGMRFSTAGSRRKKLLGFVLLGGVMAMLFILPACGGGNSGGGGGGGCTGCTPTGNYTVTITGTDASNLAHSTQVTLGVN